MSCTRAASVGQVQVVLEGDEGSGTARGGDWTRNACSECHPERARTTTGLWCSTAPRDSVRKGPPCPMVCARRRLARCSRTFTSAVRCSGRHGAGEASLRVRRQQPPHARGAPAMRSALDLPLHRRGSAGTGGSRQRGGPGIQHVRQAVRSRTGFRSRGHHAAQARTTPPAARPASIWTTPCTRR